MQSVYFIAVLNTKLSPEDAENAGSLSNNVLLNNKHALRTLVTIEILQNCHSNKHSVV
jgi:hypothetical protein